MNYLQKCFAALLPGRHRAEQLKEEKETMPDLITLYHQAETEEDKAHLLNRIFARFPETLFLASVCYPGDDPHAACAGSNAAWLSGIEASI